MELVQVVKYEDSSKSRDMGEARGYSLVLIPVHLVSAVCYSVDLSVLIMFNVLI